jgi:hypothetical protein
MKKIALFFAVLLMVFTLASCGKGKSASDGSSNGGAGKPEESRQSNDVGVPSAVNDSKGNEYAMDQTRKIIYNASTVVDVKEMKKAYDSIISKAQVMGGYIASSNIMEDYAQISVRVPALKLNEFISYIDTLGGERKQTNINSDDVTDQYTDTESRLRNLKAQEEQLILIMKKAATVEETLKVQNELYRIRGEIEVLEGRIKMWDKLVEFSTISVTLNRVKEIGEKEVKVSIISWDEIIKGMSNGFKSVLNVIIRFFSGVLIVIVSILPLVPFAALAVWLILRYRKKSRRNINQ